DCATQPTRYGLDPRATAELITDFEQRYGVTLDLGQRGLVLGFAAVPEGEIVAALQCLRHAWSLPPG
ncbi:MAG: hypothetical protein ACLGIW_05855, partial [Gammaproteobacteria bacterium]